MRVLVRALTPSSDLLFMVPVAQPRVMFSAHRIYGYDQIVEVFNEFSLVEFTLIRQRGSEPPIVEATAEQVAAERYGCGCFWFRKPQNGG